jgi:hypothetical protein
VEMHVPLERLLVDPVYNMSGQYGETAVPRDVLILGGVAIHEIVAVVEYP